MNVQFTHPYWLLLLLPGLGWVIWLAWHSDVQVGRTRWWTVLVMRTLIVLAAVFALAGLQWLHPREGMNVIFLFDRSQSIPPPQQEAARRYVVEAVEARDKKRDAAGVVVFGTQAAIEFSPRKSFELPKIQAVVGTDRTDISAAIRLGTAAFPETGQKRLVLLSDGNENIGDAMAAVLAARPVGVTLDVVPLGAMRGVDLSLSRLGVPQQVKQGRKFMGKLFLESDEAREATVRLYRNDQLIGTRPVQLAPGKNLITFEDELEAPGFYTYTAYVEAPGDAVPQNNRASGFVTVQGKARVLIVSSDPDADRYLAQALSTADLDVRLIGVERFPANLAELQSYDSLFLCNVAAGDLGKAAMDQIEAAVRDLGLGLVCIGGDQAFAAGGYRNTPLERTLPVSMELSSRKVLPKGAVVLIMHGMEFMNGNAVARECALGVLDALGPRDEMGVLLWNGTERWLFPLQEVGDKKYAGKMIAGMNQGDLPSFQGMVQAAYDALINSTANLKHIIIFSDGDPGPPSDGLMQAIVDHKITVSTVLIAGHAAPDTMIWIAERGNGRFYNIQNPVQLPQIFLKESSVILKSAIFEEPFKPRLVFPSEAVAGIGPEEFPTLQGYVCTTPKGRAEVPLVSDKGDPVLAHWQFGLGRAVAFTSDARPKWAKNWITWDRYRQFWTQVAQWSLPRVQQANFSSDVVIEKGEGHLMVEAFDDEGNYANFLNLQAVVVSPSGRREVVALDQTGPGHYEARFPTREVGPYVLNLMQVQNREVRAAQRIGISLDHSPEFQSSGPNLPLLKRLVEAGGGQWIDLANPTVNPFQHDRQKTFQPQDLWEWLLKFALILFTVEVGVRRIQIDPDDLARAWAHVRRVVLFWQARPRPVQADESLAALLARRNQVRAERLARQAEAPVPQARPDLFQPTAPPPPEAPTDKPPPAAPQAPKPPAAPAPGPPPAPSQAPAPSSTASRLLEAKRRAQQRRRR